MCLLKKYLIMEENGVEIEIFALFDPHCFSNTDYESKVYLKGFRTIKLLAQYIYETFRPVKSEGLTVCFETIETLSVSDVSGNLETGKDFCANVSDGDIKMVSPPKVVSPNIQTKNVSDGNIKMDSPPKIGEAKINNVQIESPPPMSPIVQQMVGDLLVYADRAQDNDRYDKVSRNRQCNPISIVMCAIVNLIDVTKITSSFLNVVLDTGDICITFRQKLPQGQVYYNTYDLLNSIQEDKFFFYLFK